MKIALLADIHGNAAALAAVAAALPKVDQVLFAGDACGYFASVNAVCQMLRDLRAHCIGGNHDRFLLEPPVAPSPLLQQSVAMTEAIVSGENWQWLIALPQSASVELDGKSVRMYHGSPWDADEYVYPDSDRQRFAELDADIVVLGHTHMPLSFRQGRCHVVNPGSVGLPRDGDHRASCAVLDTANMRVEFLRVEFLATAELAAVAPWRLDKMLAKYVT